MKEEGTYGAERRTKGEGIEINFMYVPKKEFVMRDTPRKGAKVGTSPNVMCQISSN